MRSDDRDIENEAEYWRTHPERHGNCLIVVLALVAGVLSPFVLLVV